MKFYAPILIFSLFFSLYTSAQEDVLNAVTKRIYTTKKLVKVPVIDGLISEDAWDVVDWSSGFVEKEPNEGREPTYQTKFKVMYD